MPIPNLRLRRQTNSNKEGSRKTKGQEASWRKVEMKLVDPLHEVIGTGFSVGLGLTQKVDRVEELERGSKVHRSSLLPRSPDSLSNPKGYLIVAPASL